MNQTYDPLGTRYHDWYRVKLIPPSGRAYYGRKCRKCELLTYAHGRLTRWRYRDGRVADTQTIDAPSCD